MTAGRSGVQDRAAPSLPASTWCVDKGEHEEVLRAVGLVAGWWRRRAEAAGLTGRWRDWRLALPEPPLPVPAEGPAPLLEDPWLLGAAYSRALHPRTRRRGGRHYTPRTLAERLWSEVDHVAGSRTPRRVVDPAAGSGALLLPPLRSHVAGSAETGSPEDVLAEVAAVFAGTDTDPVAAWLGNAVLGAELLPLWARLPARDRRPLPRLVEVGDGLEPIDDRPDVVLLNPPYGRVRLDLEARERWQTLWGHANLYQLFLEAAVDRVAEGGVVGAVLPTSWTGGAYYRRLRQYIAGVAPLRRITWVTDRSDVFSGVLQETCLAVFRKRATRATVNVSLQVMNGTVRHQRLGTASLPDDPSASWLLPRTAADLPLVKGAVTLPHRLADYGWTASTGPLVWNRHKSRIHAARVRGRTPIVWASDLDTGVVAPDPRRDSHRWIALEPRQREVMVLDHPAVLVQRTTAPEQPRRLVVAVLDRGTLDSWGGEVVVENHVNVLRCSDPKTPLTPDLLARLLATEVLDRLYRSLSGSVAVSAYELGSLPLPGPEILRGLRGLRGRELEHALSTIFGRA